MKKSLLLFTFIAISFFSQAQDLKIGDKMPNFELRNSEKVLLNSSQLKGKVVLISLFATWCGPCQLELAEVEKTLWPKYKSNDKFQLIVIGREHTQEELEKYNQRKNFSFPLYPDAERKVYSLFAKMTIPRAYLFDVDGNLIYSSIGYEKEDFEKLMQEIDKAVNQN